jgi:transmembrane sensor
MNDADQNGNAEPVPGNGEFEPAAGIEQAAAQWVCRLQSGVLPSERIQFERWLNADQRHREVYLEMDQTSHLLDLLRRPADAVANAPRPHRTKLRLIRQSAQDHPWSLVAGLAAAAAMIVAVSIWGWPAMAPKTFDRSMATAVGESYDLKLRDGSRVEINSDSLVAVHYSRTKRVVQLVRGEAFFSISKDPARPFFVEVGGVSIRAVGTAFDVRYLSDRVQVLVTAGKVRVDDDVGQSFLRRAVPRVMALDSGKGGGSGSPDSKPAESPAEPVLAAGEKAEIPRALPVAVSRLAVTEGAVDQRAIERALAWRDRKLMFDAMPLSEVVAEFNRYNGQKIVIADPALGTQRFGGAFGIHDQDAFLDVLAQGFRVEAERRPGEIILHLRR